LGKAVSARLKYGRAGSLEKVIDFILNGGVVQYLVVNRDNPIRVHLYPAVLEADYEFSQVFAVLARLHNRSIADQSWFRHFVVGMTA